MNRSSRGRTPVSSSTVVVTAVLALVVSAGTASAQRGTQRPAAAQSTPASTPQVSAAAIRVVGAGLGANGTELRPFNESPGTTVVLAIQAPRGSGIVQIDDDASRLEAFSDDKGQNLLEEGRIGPFPKVAEDGSAGIAEVEVRARPSAGASTVTVRGSLAMTLAGGSRPVRAAAVRLESGQTFKIGSATVTVGEVKTEEESTRITFGLTRSLLRTIREVRFFGAKNAPLEARRTGSGYINEKAEMEYDAKTKEKTVAIEFELWQNPRVVNVPFNVQAGLGVAAGPRASGTAGAPGRENSGDASARVQAPPPVVGATDGADSVEAVVRQLQSAALAGKGAQMLSVIYPTEREAYGQAVAMTLAFVPMASMGNEKEADAVTKELDAFFAKHKLTPPFSREPADLFKGVDVAAFVSDAMIFLKNHAKKGDKGTEMLPVPSGRAENVKITGDAAVATLNGKEVKFSRVDGRWFIHLK